MNPPLLALRGHPTYLCGVVHPTSNEGPYAKWFDTLVGSLDVWLSAHEAHELPIIERIELHNTHVVVVAETGCLLLKLNAQGMLERMFL